MSTAKLVYQGSVKDIYEQGSNELIFSFSDRYSVFDWGEMPDQIPQKGECLSLMGRFFFEYLHSPLTWKDWQCSVYLSLDEQSMLDQIRQSGFKSHYLGVSKLINNGLSVLKVDVPNDRGINT